MERRRWSVRKEEAETLLVVHFSSESVEVFYFIRGDDATLPSALVELPFKFSKMLAYWEALGG